MYYVASVLTVTRNVTPNCTLFSYPFSQTTLDSPSHVRACVFVCIASYVGRIADKPGGVVYWSSRNRRGKSCTGALYCTVFFFQPVAAGRRCTCVYTCPGTRTFRVSDNVRLEWIDDTSTAARLTTRPNAVVSLRVGKSKKKIYTRVY